MKRIIPIIFFMLFYAYAYASTATITPTATRTITATRTPTATRTITPTFTITLTAVPTATQYLRVLTVKNNTAMLEWSINSQYRDFTLLYNGHKLSVPESKNLVEDDTRFVYDLKGVNMQATMVVTVVRARDSGNPAGAIINPLTTGTPTPDGWTGFPFSLNFIQGTAVPTGTPGILAVVAVNVTPQFTPIPVIDFARNTFTVISRDEMHKKQNDCKIVDWERYMALAANASDYIAIVNPTGERWHWRGSLVTANGIAWMTPFKDSEIGGVGTTMTAFFFGQCTPIATVPVLYYSANTTTAGTQDAPTLAVGGTDAGTPSGGRSGGAKTVAADWFETFGDEAIYYIKVTAGNSETKVWLSLEAYKEED